LEIFGETYIVRSELELDELREIADYVNGKMQEMKAGMPLISTSRVAILAALNIAEELFALRRQKQEMEKEVEKRSARLIELVDECLQESPRTGL